MLAITKLRRAAISGSGIIAALTMLATGSSPATAGEPVVVTAEREAADYYTRIVRYGDLNIATASGEKMLLKRVALAVREVCPRATVSPLEFFTMDCRGYAWRGARPQIASALARSRSNGQLVSATMAIRVVGH